RGAGGRGARGLVAGGRRARVVRGRAVAARAVEVERGAAAPAGDGGVEVEHRVARLAELAVALAAARVRLPGGRVEGQLGGEVVDGTALVLGPLQQARAVAGGRRDGRIGGDGGVEVLQRRAEPARGAGGAAGRVVE